MLSVGAKTLRDDGLSTSIVSVLIPIVPCSCMNIFEFTIGSNPPLKIITLLAGVEFPIYKSLAEEYK